MESKGRMYFGPMELIKTKKYYPKWEMPHREGPDCWCEPTLEVRTETTDVWIHKSDEDLN